LTTIRSLLQAATDIDRLDAEVLLAECLGKDRGWLVAHADEEIDARDRNRFADWLNRRRAGEPVAYLTGWREFWTLRLRVTPDTLIPRPETELLVEKALDLIPPEEPVRVLDLGTGSGAIALAISTERPQALVTATDLSISAMGVARENAKRMGLTRVVFLHGNWFEPLEDRKFDLIICNPPYVAEADEHLVMGDCRFEPTSALCPGGDGLDAYRSILAEISEHLRPSGHLLVEHGHDQREELVGLFHAAGLVNIRWFDDLAGIPRVLSGQQPPL
jgi:release factor glutamine methyltransferase